MRTKLFLPSSFREAKWSQRVCFEAYRLGVCCSHHQHNFCLRNLLWVAASDRKATVWPQLRGAAGLSGMGAKRTGPWEGQWVLWVDGRGGSPSSPGLGQSLVPPFLAPGKALSLLAKRVVQLLVFAV